MVLWLTSNETTISSEIRGLGNCRSEWFTEQNRSLGTIRTCEEISSSTLTESKSAMGPETLEDGDMLQSSTDSFRLSPKTVEA